MPSSARWHTGELSSAVSHERRRLAHTRARKPRPLLRKRTNTESISQGSLRSSSAPAHDKSCLRLRPRAMTSWTARGARTRARILGQRRVPGRSARGRRGRCEAPGCRRRRRGREDRTTVAAEGRSYGSHAGTNASGPARARSPLRAGASRGQLKGRAKRPRLRRHEPAPASQARGTGSPAGPVPSAVGLPHGSGHRHRRGEGTGPTPPPRLS